MLAALGALAKPAFDLAKGWIKGRQEQQAAKQATALAVEKRRTEQAAAKGEHDAAWELAVLAQPDRAMRRLLACLLVSPLIFTVFAVMFGRDDKAKQLWAAFRLVPTEYWGTVGLILAFYFGSKTAPQVIGQLAQAFRRKTPAATPAPEATKA